MELGEMRRRIQDTPLVKKLPEDMRQRFVMMMLALADTKEVSREEKIFEQGTKDTDQGCLILEGMVRIITEESDKKTIEAPEILGEVKLFTPQGTRTATVEVVVGGKILLFKWRKLSELSKVFYSTEEMSTLKKIIHESAWTREKNLFEKIQMGMK